MIAITTRSSTSVKAARAVTAARARSAEDRFMHDLLIPGDGRVQFRLHQNNDAGCSKLHRSRENRPGSAKADYIEGMRRCEISSFLLRPCGCPGWEVLRACRQRR